MRSNMADATTQVYQGHLAKMPVELKQGQACYHLAIDNQRINLNACLGKYFKFGYEGAIHCIACQRRTKKSFNGGYCFVCFRSLAACDTCIFKPELCHYDLGTCRQPEWGEQHCMKEHVVYLANSSGIKVGVTRATQVPTRWIDQGAVQAIEFFRVSKRLYAGQVEVMLKQWVADKTNWRVMLKGLQQPIDLAQVREELYEQVKPKLNMIPDIRYCQDVDAISIQYPVITYPEKVKSFSFDKSNIIEGVLIGIKGQYLIFDGGVLNIRKFAGYDVSLSITDDEGV